jgi:hypothetical protein
MRRVLLPLLLIAAGCGGSDQPAKPQTPEQAIRGVLDRYAAAMRERDTKTMCELHSPSKVVATLEQFGYPCEEAMADLLASNGTELEASRIRVNGDKAWATITEGERAPRDLRLAREGRRWVLNP